MVGADHPDPVIREVLDVWTPRFLGSGIPPGDLSATVARMTSWDDWALEWMRTAAVHERLGEQDEAAGRMVSAAQRFMLAARCHHLAYFVYTRDRALHEQGLAAMLRCHDRALPHLEPAIEKVEIPFEEGRLVGLFSVPRHEVPPPVVLLLPGLDSTKETRHSARGGWMRRGLAVLSLDGPGQGEASRWSTIRPDYEAAVGAAIDYLEGRPDVDAGRVGLVGGSLGGYYAPRAAAFEDRVSACVGNCGPYDFGECFDVVPQVTREAFAHYSGASDMEEARRLAGRLSLAGIAERITCPLLVFHGDEDPLIPWRQGKRIVDEASGPKEFVLVEGGNHGLNNLSYRWVLQAQDWMAEQLGGTVR